MHIYIRVMYIHAEECSKTHIYVRKRTQRLHRVGVLGDIALVLFNYYLLAIHREPDGEEVLVRARSHAVK